MIQPLRLWLRSIGRVRSSCRVQSLLPLVQHREASTRYWAKSNSTHMKQARRAKAKSMTGPVARHSQFQNGAEFEKEISTLRKYLLAASLRGLFSVNVNSALPLLSWMLEMGDKTNRENFATKCEGMSSCDIVGRSSSDSQQNSLSISTKSRCLHVFCCELCGPNSRR